jgi:hypothetical protein
MKYLSLILLGLMVLACNTTPVVPGPKPTPAPPEPTATPVPTPSPTPQPVGKYEVYPSCEMPSETFDHTITFNASNPYSAKKFQPGDHLIFEAGNHGDIGLSQYDGAQFQSATKWTWFEFKPGATASHLAINGVKRVLVTGGKFSHKAQQYGKIVMVGGSENVVLKGLTINSIDDSSAWSCADWLSNAEDGFTNDDSKCISLTNSEIHNVAFAVSVFSRAKGTESSSIKTLVKNVNVHNFVGDGMRPNGSDVELSYNTIKDSMCGADEGDDNHDDGIQIFALQTSYENITIDHNLIQQSTDNKRAHIGEMQGIGYFDGVVKNLRITYNTILTSVWHGIAAYGPQDSLIDHNTVMNQTDNGRESWILAKGTTTKVSNNISEITVLDPGALQSNNYTKITPANEFVLFDRANTKFDLHLKSSSSIKDAGVYPNLAPVGEILPRGTSGKIYYIDFESGSDANDASKMFPWRLASWDGGLYW